MDKFVYEGIAWKAATRTKGYVLYNLREKMRFGKMSSTCNSFNNFFCRHSPCLLQHAYNSDLHCMHVALNCPSPDIIAVYPVDIFLDHYFMFFLSQLRYKIQLCEYFTFTNACLDRAVGDEELSFRKISQFSSFFFAVINVNFNAALPWTRTNELIFSEI